MRIAHTLLVAASVVTLLVVPSVAVAQSSPSAYTSAVRYDEMGRTTGTIAPDPDGSGSIRFAATRTTYDARGNAIRLETGELASWQSHTILPRNWSGFTIFTTVETTYDLLNRKATVRVKGSDGVKTSLRQYSYDNRGRLECTAVRMNPARFNNLPASACTLGVEGSNGPDRITKTIYDAAGQVLQVRKAVGTAVEIADVTYSYTDNGQIEYVIDANGNRAKLEYDGHGRQDRWIFSSKSRPSSFNDATPATALSTAGSLNSNDEEIYAYDDNGNRLTLTKRDGSTIRYRYDALNRIERKTIPNRSGLSSTHERDVYYSYDLQGRPIRTRFNSLSGPGQTNVYDGLGRLTQTSDNITGTTRTLAYRYDANGNRTRITYPDGVNFRYTYDGLDRQLALKDPSGAILVNATYNARGLMTRLDRYGAAHETRYGYDPAGRLDELDITAGQPSNRVNWDYTRNPASQILTETQSNDSYAWDGHVNLTRTYTTNGLNQYTDVGSGNFCYDANGNLIADGSHVFKYDVENRLVEKRAQTNTSCGALSYSGALKASLTYDPLGRLYEVSGGSAGTQRFLHDGNAMIVQYDASGDMAMRYIHGSNVDADDVLVEYGLDHSSLNWARYLYADPRGSIVLRADGAGTSAKINTYDEYGIPSAANYGRFQYTGQMYIPELDMYYYKARIYSYKLGRFMQTDPIGYEDQFNLYAYVGNDPINGVDPTGTQCDATEGEDGYSCTVDDRESFEKAGWTDNEIANFERAYTKAVNTLLSDPDKIGVVKYAGKSFRVTAGEVANNLADTWVQASADQRSPANANMDGGPGTLTRGRGALSVTRDVRMENPGGNRFIMSVFPRSRGRDHLATQVTVVHEGLHTARGHRVFNGTGYIRGGGHSHEFNRTARALLGMPLE